LGQKQESFQTSKPQSSLPMAKWPKITRITRKSISPAPNGSKEWWTVVLRWSSGPWRSWSVGFMAETWGKTSLTLKIHMYCANPKSAGKEHRGRFHDTSYLLVCGLHIFGTQHNSISASRSEHNLGSTPLHQYVPFQYFGIKCNTPN
jgi:hypothetical protein